MAGILNAIGLSSQGLSIQRSKMNVVAQNIANAETTKTEKGGPYRRQRVVVNENKVKGNFNSYLKKANGHLMRTNSNHLAGNIKKMSESAEFSSVDMNVVEDPESSFKEVYDPTHPEADENGYVKYPDIEIVNEMVDMMAASRAYSTAKKMAEEALDI
ncbi:MAG: flagellar basal body rod protein FlgC [Candidatus Zixiibacteriota bacterium]